MSNFLPASHAVEQIVKSQELYDKTILSLSGGALALSITFVKDIIGNKQQQMTEFLLFAWIAWAVSLTCVLLSFATSHQVYRNMLKDIKQDRLEDKGGIIDLINTVLNFGGGLLFIGG